MIKFTFKGLMPPVFTPFKNDFTIDYSVIPVYIKYLNDNDIKGILVNGTSGEGMSMSVDERKKVTEVWIKEAHKLNMHVMVQVGGAPLPDVLELAQHAESCNADSLLTLPELFNKPKTVPDLVRYLKIIGEKASKTPLLYYHNPAYSGVALSMTELVRQSRETIPTFRGMKYTSTDLLEAYSVLDESGDEFSVFLGADQLLLPAITQNLNSAIGTTYNIYPKVSSEIFNAMETMKNRDDFEKCRKQQKSLNVLINIILFYGEWVPAMKMAMEILTKIKVGPPRPPLQSLNENQRSLMENELKKKGYF